jgi:plasmid replication initiation protein
MKNIKEEILLVKKHNYSLFENYTKMGLIQYKIMNLVISKINNNLKLEDIKDEDLIITITKEQLENEYLNTKIYSKRLAAQINQLLDKKIRHTNDLNSKEPKWKIINIFTCAEYDNNILTIEINKGVINYFIELKSNFTQYYFRYLTGFSSVYSIVNYEILKMNEYKFKNKGYYKKSDYIQFDIEELYKIYGLTTDGTRNIGFLKNRILDLSKKEINETTDIQFEYKEVKKGKKVIAIQFYLIEESANLIDILRNKPKHLLKDWENILLLAEDLEKNDPVKTALLEQVKVLKQRSNNSIDLDMENKISYKIEKELKSIDDEVVL